MNESFSLIYVLRILLKWKWMILSLVIASGVAAVIISIWVLPEIYKSSAKFYPINQGITDRSMLFNEGNSMNYVDYYGTKQDMNRVVELANSSPITDFIINYYRLADHYGVDTTEDYWRSRVKKKFEKRYTAVKTENEAIEITFKDTDPQMAADVVNMILTKIDEHNKAPIIKNKMRIVETFRKKVAEKKVEVDSLAKQLVAIADKYSIKTTQVSDASYNITGSSNEGMAEYKLLREKHDNALKELGELQKLFEEYDVSSRENVPSITVLEQAWPADHRDSPVRSVFCVLVVSITAVVSIVLALMLEQIKIIRSQLANAG